MQDDYEWKWLAAIDLDINNLHIKNAFIYDDKLIIFSRGQPQGVIEVCISFLLIFSLVTQDDEIISIDPNYKYIRVDPLTYAEFQARPIMEKTVDNLIIQMP